MATEKLSDIKKELAVLNNKALAEICLKLAKYKKDNKELLSYLLFEADDPFRYAEEVKTSLLILFTGLSRSPYSSTKELRKILRLLNKHARYTSSKEVELELLLWFCNNFLEYADTRSTHKPLHTIFQRQMEKISKTLPKLHEDLQFDYRVHFDRLKDEARARFRYFDVHRLS